MQSYLKIFVFFFSVSIMALSRSKQFADIVPKADNGNQSSERIFQNSKLERETVKVKISKNNAYHNSPSC